MKKKALHIAHSNLPMRCPFAVTLVYWLVLDRLDAPGWIWGAVGVFLLIGWLAWIYQLFTHEEVDVLGVGK